MRPVASRSVVFLLILLFAPIAYADNSASAPKLPGPVSIDQKLNAQIPLDLMFRDETGAVVRLRQEFRGKPVLLNFMYYRCPMLCSMVMDGISSALSELTFTAGKEFDVLTVSIDPRDTPEQAAARKDIYLKRYGRLGAGSGWHFLTGNESAIKALADAVGFHFAYDPQHDQFAHGTVLIAATPDGRVSRYLYGFTYQPRDVRLALVEASARKIGTPTDALLLLCYHYDPATGKYSRTAMNFVRAGGIATVFGLVGFVGVMLRHERKQKADR